MKTTSLISTALISTILILFPSLSLSKTALSSAPAVRAKILLDVYCCLKGNIKKLSAGECLNKNGKPYKTEREARNQCRVIGSTRPNALPRPATSGIFEHPKKDSSLQVTTPRPLIPEAPKPLKLDSNLLPARVVGQPTSPPKVLSELRADVPDLSLADAGNKFPLGPADLELELIIPGMIAMIGANISYTIKVKNIGGQVSSADTSVVLWLGSDPSINFTVPNQLGSWTIPQLGPNIEHTITDQFIFPATYDYTAHDNTLPPILHEIFGVVSQEDGTYPYVPGSYLYKAILRTRSLDNELIEVHVNHPFQLMPRPSNLAN